MRQQKKPAKATGEVVITVISPDHLAMLAASGITPEYAALRGYETVTDRGRLAELNIVRRRPAHTRPTGADAPCRRLHMGMAVPAR